MEFEYQVCEIKTIYTKLIDKKQQITSSDDVYNIVKPYFNDYYGLKEAMFVLYMDNANHVKAIAKIGEGTAVGCMVDIKDIVKKLIDVQARSLIMIHNHPSGNMNPSEADKQITNKVKEALKYFDSVLFDHLIIDENNYYSFADKGLI